MTLKVTVVVLLAVMIFAAALVVTQMTAEVSLVVVSFRIS